MKRKKHFITFICLLIGMLVFTTAVYANYDNAKGYSNYKNALKNLAFEANNYTAKYDMTIKIDEERTHSSSGIYKCADGNKSQYTKGLDYYDGQIRSNYESYYYEYGNKSYSYFPEEDKYYQAEINREGNGSLMGTNDATAKKAVRFAELLADMLVGDLKNNVILTSSEEGINKYIINVSGNQIPEIVNAGLSLLFTENNSNNRDQEMAKFGNDPYIDDVTFKVTLDKEGRLVENQIEAALVGEDENGEKHTAVMKGNLTIFDYETTVVDVFDPEGKTKIN